MQCTNLLQAYTFVHHPHLKLAKEIREPRKEVTKIVGPDGKQHGPPPRLPVTVGLDTRMAVGLHDDADFTKVLPSVEYLVVVMVVVVVVV